MSWVAAVALVICFLVAAVVVIVKAIASAIVSWSIAGSIVIPIICVAVAVFKFWYIFDEEICVDYIKDRKSIAVGYLIGIPFSVLSDMTFAAAFVGSINWYIEQITENGLVNGVLMVLCGWMFLALVWIGLVTFKLAALCAITEIDFEDPIGVSVYYAVFSILNVWVSYIIVGRVYPECFMDCWGGTIFGYIGDFFLHILPFTGV